MKATVIVAVYNRDDYIPVVLNSLVSQVFDEFQVVIAEDGCSESIRSIVSTYKNKFLFPIVHVTQKDEGFRKNRILNEAIRQSSGDYLVFIDGDCVLHPKYLSNYMMRAEEGRCLFGRRVMLDEKTTKSLVLKKDVSRLGFFRLIFSGCRKKEEAIYFPFLPLKPKKGVFGCSFCVARKDIVAINGFDEDFESPFYGEDTDIERRLILSGVKTYSTKFATIQYHLFHDPGDRRRDWKRSQALYEAKAKKRLSVCQNGLVPMK